MVVIEKYNRTGQALRHSVWLLNLFSLMSSLQTLPSSCPAQEAAIVAAFATSDATLGPSYLCVVVSSLVCGIACCQAYCYFQSERTKQDNWILKSCVALLVLVATLQQAFIIHSLYYYLVKNFENPCTFLQQIIWSLPANIALNVCDTCHRARSSHSLTLIKVPYKDRS